MIAGTIHLYFGWNFSCNSSGTFSMQSLGSTITCPCIYQYIHFLKYSTYICSYTRTCTNHHGHVTPINTSDWLHWWILRCFQSMCTPLPLKSYLGENATIVLSQSLEFDGQIPSQGT
jgi:hypothetical protein